MPESPEEETGRLARWSRLKQAAREGAPEPEAAPLPATAPEPEPDPAELEANRAAAEAVDAALAGLGCDVGELRGALNRARHGMLDLLRVPVS